MDDAAECNQLLAAITIFTVREVFYGAYSRSGRFNPCFSIGVPNVIGTVLLPRNSKSSQLGFAKTTRPTVLASHIQASATDLLSGVIFSDFRV